MTMTGSQRPPRSSAVVRWTLGTAGLTFLSLLAGVGLAAVLGRRGAPQDWSKWSDVGQTFGALSSIISGLALVVVVVTARIQVHEMQRSATAELSMLHLEILKLGINDEELAEVWPALLPDISPKLSRQFLYANIIYQFHWTTLRLEKATDEEVLGSMRYLFTNPLMREYWAAAERGRTSLAPGSPEQLFAKSLDDLCRDYETAVTAARHRAEPRVAPEPRAKWRVDDETAA
jgi:Family of unknown function (DUF6082)